MGGCRGKPRAVESGVVFRGTLAADKWRRFLVC